MKNIGYAGLSMMLCLTFAMPVMSQTPSPAEVACNAKYGKYYAAQTNMTLADDFLNDATCKDSMYREGTYQLMAAALVGASKWKEALDLTNRFGKEMPNAGKPARIYINSQGLAAANQTGDLDKIIDSGEKLLTVDPDNLNAILIVATTIPDKLPTDPAAMDKAMARAVELAKKLLAMTKPEAVDGKVWQQQVLGPAHGVVGFVLLQKKEYVESIAEYEQAVKINPRDQVSWFRKALSETKIAIAAQGLIQPAYDILNLDSNRTPGPERDALIEKRDAIEKDFREKRDKAIDSYISTVALGDPIAKQARVTLESLYNPSHNGTSEGLDELIAKRKTELK